jgi:small subunit ribosomal protein S2
MLTNFPTIRKAVKKMSAIDKMATDGTFDTLSKRERLQITRQRAKLEKNLGSIADLTRLPAAMFIVDVHKEYIAVREANRLNIPVFAMVDTNSDPRNIDFPIPSNDDASKSISLIIEYVGDAVAEGLSERKMEKEKEASESKAKSQKKAEAAEAAKKEAASDKKAEKGSVPEKESAKAEVSEEKTAKAEEPKKKASKAKETPKEEAEVKATEEKSEADAPNEEAK